jgi:uncharacterized protein (TIGR04141 family)
MTHSVKLYLIDSGHFELEELNSNGEIIQFLVRTHKQSIHNFDELENPIVPIEHDGNNYYLYKYDERNKVSSWESFFPPEIIEGEDFSIESTSFVLFCSTDSNLYCFIGGSAITVVKRYLNQTFGLDLFERIAIPDTDIVTSITTRGISGNLNSQNVTFRQEQKLIDSLSLTRLPVRATIQLRETLIADVFDFLDVEEGDKIFLDIGTSFYIKTKLTFHQCHQLVNIADDILTINEFTSLSAFEKIRDDNIIDNNLRPLLYSNLFDDMSRIGPPGRNISNSRFDFDLVHPSKLSAYYQCDRYSIYERNAHQPFYETPDRESIYESVLKYIYNNIEEQNLYNFKIFLSGIRIYGFRGEDRVTHAMFEDHVTCEMLFNNRPVFKIDSRWYYVKGDFIERISSQCESMCRTNYWGITELDQNWDVPNEDEGVFNLKYFGRDNFIVLDKCLGDNIELCDILYESESTVYLIHVKAGFDAKIRDLSNQVSVSSNRLWDDIKSGNYSFVNGVVDSYNAKQHVIDELNYVDFQNLFNKKVVFVMAFASSWVDGRSIIENMNDVGSNIAKFSLIQSIREMNTEKNTLLIHEISR